MYSHRYHHFPWDPIYSTTAGSNTEAQTHGQD